MRDFSVRDIDLSQITNAIHPYDAALFASGFEQRARFFASKMNREKFNNGIVMGFQDHPEVLDRIENDSFLCDYTKSEIISAHPLDDTLITKRLSAAIEGLEKPRILVDISSMSRSWYAAILNWARYSTKVNALTIDFVYSEGAYEADEFPKRVISNISCISGCEGQPGPNKQSVAVFGLGYDQFAPPAVLEYLEPDRVYAFYGYSNTEGISSNRALDINKEFIASISEPPIPFPTRSVRSTFSGLIELASGYINEANIVLIPLGPKTHVLGSMLAAMKFSSIACLHVSGRFRSPLNVLPRGNIAACRVVFSE